MQSISTAKKTKQEPKVSLSAISGTSDISGQSKTSKDEKKNSSAGLSTPEENPAATQFLRFRPRQYLDENKFESYHLNMDETMIMNPTNHVSHVSRHGRSGRSTVPQNTRHVGMPQITMITFGIYQGDKAMKLNGIQRGKNPSEMTPEESYRLLEEFSLKTSLKSSNETSFSEDYSAEGEDEQLENVFNSWLQDANILTKAGFQTRFVIS